MKVKIKKLHKNAVIPKLMSSGAACMDVVATEIIKDDELVTVKLGFSTEIPEGYKAIIVPRSSFTHKGWIMANSPAQIDSDYRGEWMLKFEAITGIDWISENNSIKLHNFVSEFPYKIGDRVAQMYIEKVIDFEFEEVSELSKTERNEGAFGSTN